MKEDTLIVTSGRNPEEQHGFVNPPVYHASTILHETVESAKAARERRWEPGTYTYGRHGTPTHEALEESVAALEGGWRSMAMGSGLAAINAALLAFLKAGDHLLMVDSVYGPARNFCNNFLGRFGVEVTYYDPVIGAGIKALIRDNTRLVYMESPGSLTFEVQDVPAIADAAHGAGCVAIIDNTWSAGVYFKPFAHGIDVSVQAGTKYIVGHSDAMLGLITVTEEHWRTVRQAAAMLAAPSGPDDVYLALRGLRTIKVRLERQYRTGLVLARWLQTRDEVVRVLHPALPDFPTHDLWKRDFTGASGLFGVELAPCSADAVAAMLDGLKYYGMGASWGGFESLILPTYPANFRSVTDWISGPMLRIHAGLEDPDDLIADLEDGFQRLNASA